MIRSIVRKGSLPVLAAGAYAALVRPRMLRWGATREEATTAYPGDELIEGATAQSTMAVSLPAPPEDVWPWLVQMGCGRAAGTAGTSSIIEDGRAPLGSIRSCRTWRSAPAYPRYPAGASTSLSRCSSPPRPWYSDPTSNFHLDDPSTRAARGPTPTPTESGLFT